MYGAGKKGESSDKDIILELGHTSSTVAPMSIRTSTTPPATSFLNALVPCTVKHIVFSAVVVIVSFACFFWIAGDNSLTQPKFPTPAASDDDSATKDEMSSAPVFTGARIRTLPLNSDVLILNTKLSTFTWTDAATTELQPVCASWGVVVTVQAPKKSLAKALEQQGLCLVVVADKQTPLEDYIALTKANTPEHFLKLITVEDQFNLLSNGLEIMNELPWNHFGRKNVGYLYAIAQGATVVFDFQEDIEFISSLPVYSSSSKWSMVDVKAPIVNPYSAFTSFQTVKNVPWPRGFPLTQINNKSTWSSSNLGPPVAVPLQNIGVVQSLIAVNYDMDAIWRMTKQGNPINVKQGVSMLLPPGTMASYNSHATLHYALWGLMLPVSVHGRVSDIWRSYIMQRLMVDVGQSVGYVSPFVENNQLSSNIQGNFMSEASLYEKTEALIKVLNNWKSVSNFFEERLLELFVRMYECDFVELIDVVLVQKWVRSLKQIGYVFPAVLEQR